MIDCGILEHYQKNNVSLQFDSRSMAMVNEKFLSRALVIEAAIWVTFNYHPHMKNSYAKEGMVNEEITTHLY